MTGTLHGYMVYRLQGEIKKRGGPEIPYSIISGALLEVLAQLDKDMDGGEYIELPNGRELIKARY